ncbi:MAG: hypothetical protein R3C45_02915 [Phycisphaerales bacterium]
MGTGILLLGISISRQDGGCVCQAWLRVLLIGGADRECDQFGHNCWGDMALYTQKDRNRLALRLLVWASLMVWVGLVLLPAFFGGIRPDHRSELEKSIPWVLPQLAALLLVMVAYSSANLNWRPNGICRQCGYDLRGSIPAGREACPECGEAIWPDVGLLRGPVPPRLRILRVLLIVIPVLTFLTVSVLAFAPTPYEPLADPKYSIRLHDWPERFRRNLEFQLMLRYVVINLLVCALSIAMVFQYASRRVSIWVMVMPIVSVLLFCAFSYGLLPVLR